MKLDAREVSDNDVPIWNFQNGQSPKEWGSRDTKVVAVIWLVRDLGMPPFQKSAVFLNIVQKAFDPPPLLFEHLSYFAGGVF